MPKAHSFSTIYKKSNSHRPPKKRFRRYQCVTEDFYVVCLVPNKQFSGNYEADASKFLENVEDMFLDFIIVNDINCNCIYPPIWGYIHIS